MALAAQVVGDGEYPMVVVVGRHGGRKALGGLVVQLDPQRPALLVGGQGLGERAVLQAQPFEMAQGVAGRPAQLGVVALPSSSINTTIGSTTACSSKRTSARGSASRTDVSST